MAIIRANNNTLSSVTTLPFATGGLVLLSRQVVSSAVSEVVFNNTLITSTYDDYLFRMNAVVPVTDTANQRFQTSGDNGSSFDTNWYSNSIYVRITDSAVNYLKFYFSSGNIASGTFSLYGLVKT